MKAARSQLRRLPPSLGAALTLAAVAAPAAADMGDPPFNRMTQVEELEYGFNNRSNPLNWDSTSWIGGDWNRIWFKTEGEMTTDEIGVQGEAQALYGRLVAPFWDLQIGVRGDLVAEPGGREGRGLVVVGLEGLAPYWFELEPAVFVSHEGDISARFRTTYDLFITQRLIAHPSFEMNVAIQSVPDFGVGSGFNDIELGLRLGYQLARELTPYVGVSWTRAFAETARLRRDAGERESDVQGVAGLRFWF